MDFSLKNKNALVLAASKGLGRAAALTLAAEGANVAICARNAETLTKTAEELRALGVRIISKITDIADGAALKAFINEAGQSLGGIDVLVTNAGGPPVRTFAESREEEWEYWYQVTVMSVIRAIKATLPFMETRPWGRIINITSISVKSPVEALVYSNSLRLAVVGLAKTLSIELGPKNITVNNVAPGYHLTDGLERIITKRVEAGASREDVIDGWTNRVPLRRIGEAENLADLIAFLASERASYISGTTIQCDGGAYTGTL